MNDAPLIRAFDGCVPRSDVIERVVAPPVSSITTDRYAQLIADNPDSILNLLGSAIDTGEGGGDPAFHDQLGAVRLQKMIDEGLLVHQKGPVFYVLKIGVGERSHVGIVCEINTVGLDDGRIKRHENTRSETESMVARHLEIIGAHTDPVAMTYRMRPELNASIEAIVANREPSRDFVADDGSRQTLWVVGDPMIVQVLSLLVAAIPAVYITDGHHRTAAASRLRKYRQSNNADHTGFEPYNFLLTVLFAEGALELHSYNRAVTDLNGMTEEEVLVKLAEVVEVEEVSVAYAEAARPVECGTMAMYLGSRWYRLTFRPTDIPNNDPRGALDAVLLQELILDPVFGIKDARADSRLHYVPGPAGLAELEQHDAPVAFALHAASVADVMDVADRNEVMPPKSTWFSPKIRTGLVIRKL